jgi:nitrogen fixation protein NifB
MIEIESIRNLLHPCFEASIKHKYGRVHLPVAPKCNIQCNYCDRKFDCLNESRPGVSSLILSPQQALSYLFSITNKFENLTVAGIAGPGDPFANPEETLATVKLVREHFPKMIICLSTNGLELAKHIDILKKYDVSHLTITINAIDPIILSFIISWIRYNKKVYRGVDAASLLIDKQFEALQKLKENGFIVKINSIIIPEVNDFHIPLVAESVAGFGADTFNCIPLIPNKNTVFENIEPPSDGEVLKIQKQISQYIKPMKHCSRCRADSAGLLGQDIPETFQILKSSTENTNPDKPNVAVATEEGVFVNKHLGEASCFAIFSFIDDEYKFIEARRAPLPGNGDLRWQELAEILSDCRCILVSGAGANPTKIIDSRGIKIIQMNGLIEEGLSHVYRGEELKTGSFNRKFKCGDSCGGDGQGCG